MKERFLMRILFLVTVLALAVLWLVSMFVTIPLDGGFSIYWVIAILSALAGVLFVLKGLLVKNVIFLKRISIIFGAILLAGALMAIVQIYADLNRYTLPIIAIIISVAFLLCTVIAKGKSWDSGDNQKSDYKSYHERKKEQQENNTNSK